MIHAGGAVPGPGGEVLLGGECLDIGSDLDREVHAVLKSDLAAGMMPSGRFGANAAWLWLSALALNAMALVRRAACGHEWRWVRMKRIRAVWIHLVARVVRHGRRRGSNNPETPIRRDAGARRARPKCR